MNTRLIYHVIITGCVGGKKITEALVENQFNLTCTVLFRLP